MLHSAEAAPISQDGVGSLLKDGEMPSAAGYKAVMAHIPKSILKLAGAKKSALGEAKVPLPADAPHESWKQAEKNIQASMASAIKKAASAAAAQANAAQVQDSQAAAVKAAEAKVAAGATAKHHKAPNAKNHKAPKKVAKKPHGPKSEGGDGYGGGPDPRVVAHKAHKAPDAAHKAGEGQTSGPKQAPKKKESKKQNKAMAPPKAKKATPAQPVKDAAAAKSPPVKKAPKSNKSKNVSNKKLASKKKAAKAAVMAQITKNFDAVEGTKNGEAHKPVGKKAPSKVSRRGHVNAHKPAEASTPQTDKKAAATTAGKTTNKKADAQKKKAPHGKVSSQPPDNEDNKPEDGYGKHNPNPTKKPPMEKSAKNQLPPLKKNAALGEHNDEVHVPKDAFSGLTKFEKKSKAMTEMEKLATSLGIHQNVATKAQVAPATPKKARKLKVLAHTKKAHQEALWMKDLKKHGGSMSRGIKLPSLSAKLPKKLEFTKAELKPKKPKKLVAKKPKKVKKKVPKRNKQHKSELGEGLKEQHEDVLKDLLPKHQTKMWPLGKLTFGSDAGDDEELIQELDPSDDERESHDTDSADETQEDSVAATQQPFFHHKHKPLFKHYKYAKKQESHDLGESSTIEHPVVRARKQADDHERPTEETYQPDEIEEDYDPIDDMLKANGWSRDRLMSKAQLQAQQNVGGGPAPHRGYQMSESGDGSPADIGEDGDDEQDDLGESNNIDDDDHEEGQDDDNDHEEVMTPQDKAEKAHDEARSTAKATAQNQADLGNEGELSEDDDHPDLGESGGVSVPALHPDQADAAGDEDAAGDAEKNLEAGDTP